MNGVKRIYVHCITETPRKKYTDNQGIRIFYCIIHYIHICIYIYIYKIPSQGCTHIHTYIYKYIYTNKKYNLVMGFCLPGYIKADSVFFLLLRDYNY